MKKYILHFAAACIGLVLAACGAQGSQSGQPAATDTAQVSTFYGTAAAKQAPADAKAQGGQTKAQVKTLPLEQPARMKDAPELILKRRGYIVSYNKDTKLPNWVAWHLTAAHTKGDVLRDDMLFGEDHDTPMPRVTDDDYYNSGFDRGHMCPAGDNKWDRRAMTETFLFSNVCPQVHALNAGAWNDLEVACRKWAQKYGGIYIVCGPLLDKGRQHRTIGRRKVVVPERFFKVILCMRGTPKAIGFIYENSSANSRSMFKNATTVDEVERLSGIDFFPKLRDDIETQIEAERGYF